MADFGLSWIQRICVSAPEGWDVHGTGHGELNTCTSLLGKNSG